MNKTDAPAKPGDVNWDAEADALILDAAAGVLKSRYGKLIAGDLIQALTGQAAAIRKESR